MAKNKNNTANGGAGNNGADIPPIPPRTFWQTINPGYVVAGMSTIVNALFLSTNKNFHKTLERMGLTKELDDGLKTVMEEHVHKKSSENDKTIYDRLKGVAQDAEREKDSTEEIRKKVSKAAAKIESEIEESVGLSGNYAKRTLQKFTKLPAFYQGQIATTVITVTSIALGAVYSFARERHLTNQLNREVARRNTEHAQSNNGPGV